MDVSNALASSDYSDSNSFLNNIGWYIAGGGLVTYLLSGIKIIRPTQRGLIERLGKYKKFAEPGFNWIFPFIDKMRKVNITEMMVEAGQQEVITKDNLNAKVDAQVYFKIRPDVESVKNSQYNVDNYLNQIVALEKTTLRSIMGTLSLKEANSDRSKINTTLASELKKEANYWGVDIVRAELKEIDPPKDVQETMNEIVKAENEKLAALDFATAAETKADGLRRAEIKAAEGKKQAKILEADGESQAIMKVASANAEAIKVINEASEKYFKGNAVEYRKLEVLENTLKDNAKYVIPQGTSLIALLDQMKENVIPVPIATAQEITKK
ncbi:SPFH/Band 7/PHB domain protein [Candidatus Pacearchaeota archaeon]|nr:SPFH/Band 7/PHB domain protein [Candidatus Pacearchaeota archaeon]MBI2056824.1 SPFH/Band 7/PHB domain protein [Candidatus Pacearchaeota archaeon]